MFISTRYSIYSTLIKCLYQTHRDNRWCHHWSRRCYAPHSSAHRSSYAQRLHFVVSRHSSANRSSHRSSLACSCYAPQLHIFGCRINYRSTIIDYSFIYSFTLSILIREGMSCVLDRLTYSLQIVSAAVLARRSRRVAIVSST